MQAPVLLFFNISGGELLIILMVAFVVFGPSRIPEIARKIGRGLNEIRRASDEIKREITKETRNVENSLGMDELDFSGTRKPGDRTAKESPGRKFPDQTKKPGTEDKEDQKPTEET